MDYKTTKLTNQVIVDEDFYPDIPGLHFGILGETKSAFDYTAYFEENELPPIDYKAFMRQNKHNIESLANRLGLPTSEMFFENTDGHILITSELVFLCLMFVNPDIMVYFNALLGDILSNGVAFSSGYIYDLAASRLPSDILSEILSTRNNENTEAK